MQQATRAATSPQISADGWWYWDGYRWRAVDRAYARRTWDPRTWKPAPSKQPSVRTIPVMHLIGLLILDVVGMVGVVPASVVAAAVLLAIDPRGLVTLNGLIKWKRLSFAQKMLTALLEVVLFQFLVLVYLVRRLWGAATAAFRPVAAVGPDRVVGPGPATDLDDRTSAAPLDADAIEAALSSLVAHAKNRLPRDLFEKVRAVVAEIGRVLPAYRGSHLEPHDRFVVERTAGDYLPSAVRTYLKLPVDRRSVPIPDAGGKTANEVLSDQLDLLIGRLRQVADSAYRDDLKTFLTHGRFLHSKFGGSSLSINS